MIQNELIEVHMKDGPRGQVLWDNGASCVSANEDARVTVQIRVPLANPKVHKGEMRQTRADKGRAVDREQISGCCFMR